MGEKAKDVLLEKVFEDERWIRAIQKGIVKDIDRSVLRALCDGTWRAKMREMIENGTYTIVPPHAQLIPKDKPGEFRTVYINEGADRVLLSIVNEVLFEVFPDFIHGNCLSYQMGIGCGKIVQKCNREIRRAMARWYKRFFGWKSDLSKFFDTVPYWVIERIFQKMEQRVGKSAVIELLRRYYQQNKCFDVDGNVTEKYMSLMQGCAVAAFLADAVLFELDERMSSLGGFYVRYSDDCLYIGENYEQAMDVMRETLNGFELTLNPKKVEYLDADHWFKFLGFSLKGTEISISKGRLEKFAKEIQKRTIKNRRATYNGAIRSVQRYMYYGDGEYSWATGILPIITNRHDIEVMNEYVMDCLRAVKRNRHKVGGLGYVKDGKDGCVVRGLGRNVKANRLNTEQRIDGYHSIAEMRNALLYARPLYDTIVRSEIK